MATATLEQMTQAEELDTRLYAISNNIIGFERVAEPEAGIDALYYVTFNCEHDLVLCLVYPESGEPFAQVDYGYFPTRPKEARRIEDYLTPHTMWDFGSENPRYPYARGEDVEVHSVGVQAVALVKEYLASI